MAHVDWSIKGPELSTCNCDWGCPCQFNSIPTSGHCRAAVAVRIDRGHFADIRLDGLHWACCVAWPGAIHEGNGECLTIVDERADQPQREALLKIMSGEETEPGATIFSVFAPTFTTVHPPRFEPIQFETDMDARIGHFSVPGIVEARGEPIRSPISGQPHRARLVLPHGFEYVEAEFANSVTKADGLVPLDWGRGHAHFALLHLTPNGPVH